MGAGFPNPIVRNGVVELWGATTDKRERQALVVAAENVPGVKAVRDQLVWSMPPGQGHFILEQSAGPKRSTKN